jgi:hypothetical protein
VAKNEDGDNSDAETFVSASSSELRSSTDDPSELPSFGLSLFIFPIISPPPPAAASPFKIIHKLPFGYVIGHQEDTLRPSCATLPMDIKKVMPVMSVQMMKKNVVRAVKGTFRRASWPSTRRGEEREDADAGCSDDEVVFWKKDVRGLRCRRVEDEDTVY